MAVCVRFLMVGSRGSVPRRDRACRRARGRQGRCAPLKRWPEDGPSLTAAARDGTDCAQVGTEGWCRSNKRMGLPDTASRTVYRIREGEVPILSATITVMKKISFRSILLRPSNCTRLIRSHDFRSLCCRWNRPIFWATLTMETNRKPSRIVIGKYGESHQLPCSGSNASGFAKEIDHLLKRLGETPWPPNAHQSLIRFVTQGPDRTP